MEYHIERLVVQPVAVVRAHVAVDGIPAFLAGAAALRHVRADPLLPAELLPADWPGAGKALGQIHPLVLVNFTLGWLAVAAVIIWR